MSLSNLLKPEMPLAEVAMVTTEYVFGREKYAVAHDERDSLRWESIADFAEPLSVVHYSGEGLTNYRFDIHGEMADQLVIFPDNENGRTLAKDPFAEYFFERFAGIFDGHEHMVCLRSLRMAREYRLKKEALLKAQAERNSMADGQPIRITDRRKRSA